MTELTVPTILSAAADLIEMDGWTQGGYQNVDGCHCAVGAICAVSTGDPGTIEEPTIEAGEALARMIDPQLEVSMPPSRLRFHYTVVRWNDDEERTQQEVVDTLRAAAKAAEQVPA